MILEKPKFWDQKISIYSILLFPLTVFVLLFIFLKKMVIKPIKFKIPIICVGNIYVGGTGKTPVSILLANELTKLGHKPVILKKYYRSHRDEHDLIRANYSNLILDRDRMNGIKKAEKANYDAVILDDGFQDYKINKDLNIICFNENQLIGNGLVLPSGPLRENLKSLNNAHIILINGAKNIEFEKKILNINRNIEIFYTTYNPINMEQFKNKKLLAVAAIANPNNFFNLIKSHNLKIEKELVYPDHYEFSEKEIKNIIHEAKINNYHIIMTEKDYFKFKSNEINSLNYLKISLKVENYEKFIKKIKKIYDKKN